MADVAGNASPIEGASAHDAAADENPVRVGLKAVSHGATPASVASLDVTDWLATRAGQAFVIGGHPNVETLHRKDTAAQTDAVLKTVNANERFVVTAVAMVCANSNSVDVQGLVEFGALSPRVAEHPGMPPGGGLTWGNGGGILAIGAAADDLLWTCEVPTGGSIVVVVTGYLIAEA